MRHVFATAAHQELGCKLSRVSLAQQHSRSLHSPSHELPLGRGPSRLGKGLEQRLLLGPHTTGVYIWAIVLGIFVEKARVIGALGVNSNRRCHLPVHQGFPIKSLKPWVCSYFGPSPLEVADAPRQILHHTASNIVSTLRPMCILHHNGPIVTCTTFALDIQGEQTSRSARRDASANRQGMCQHKHARQQPQHKGGGQVESQ